MIPCKHCQHCVYGLCMRPQLGEPKILDDAERILRNCNRQRSHGLLKMFLFGTCGHHARYFTPIVGKWDIIDE